MARPPAAKSPAAPHPVRQVVVLRPGPPPPKRGYKDLVAGILGILLLIASGVLAVNLPKTDILPPQFKITFEQEHKEPFPSVSHYFNKSDDKGRHHIFVFNVSDDDVLAIQVNVYFTDDLPASDPDRFQVELYDPDGAQQPPTWVLANAPPQQNQTAPGAFVAAQASATYSFGLRQKPDDTIGEGRMNDTTDSVAAANETLNHFTTHGEWKVKVYLADAGDCPTPSPLNPSPDDALRSSVCLNSSSGSGKDAGKDRGNLFTVGSFSYTRFTVSAERLG